MENNIKPLNEYLGRKYTISSAELFGSFHIKGSENFYSVYSSKTDDGLNLLIAAGLDEPADNTEVTVIAVMHEKKNNSSIFLTAHDKHLGTEICYECNIKTMFGIENDIIDVLYEKTCGAVMFTEKDSERRYLLIENDSGHIGFPKGHVENGETETETAIREVMEETALRAEPIDGFRMSYSYTNASGHRKTAVYFLSHYDYTAAVIQQEELTNSWLLPYDEAIKMLNYPQDIPVLEGAEKFLDKA